MNKRKTLRDIYKTYEYTEDSPHYVDYKDYRKIVEVVLSLFVKYMVTTGNRISLPHGLGYLYIRKGKDYDKAHKKVDFNMTKKLGKVIYHNNRHSNGFYGKFRWDKNKHYIKNKQLFKFVPCRWAKRYLSKEIKENNTIVRYGF
jgi:hypothetical protein